MDYRKTRSKDMTKEEEKRALELLRRTGDYTDEEYSLMDEYVSTHEIKVKAANRGILARNKAHLIAVDNISAAYLNARPLFAARAGAC
jgi:hypothetical protein